MENQYAKWFGRVTWAGIAANTLFIIPICFFPESLLSLLHMTIPIPIIWVRAFIQPLFPNDDLQKLLLTH